MRLLRSVLCLVLLAPLIALTSLRAQQNWEWVNTLPASIGWKGAAYGNGLYVVVGSDGLLVTSPDAVTWTPRRTVSTAASLNAVTFANGMFVAVGSDASPSLGSGLILTSTDGITWTKNSTVASTILAQLASVAYGNNTWVISGASQNRVLTSSDGLTWTVRSAGTTTGRMAFGNGVFVALTNNNRAVTSADGVTWTTTTLNAATGSFYEGIAFGAGRFVAVGRAGTSFNASTVTSTDGSTWTINGEVASSDGGTNWVAYGNNAFAMAGNGGLFSSTDGATWTKRTSAMPPTRSSSTNSLSTENFGAVAAANNTLFTFGIYGSITTSSDGVTWTRRSTGTAHDINGLVHDGNRFVGVGTGGVVVTSPNGIAWTASTTNQTGWFGMLAYSNGVYAASGLNGLYTSTDLATWTNRGNTSFNQMWGVIHANGRFVAANRGISTGLLVSTDGVTWTTVRITGASGNVAGLAYGNGVYVLTTSNVGLPAKVYTSTDATTWTDRTPTNFTTPESLAFANGRFVALTGLNSWVSTDGIAWSTSTLLLPLRTVFAVGNKFVARNGYACALSEDGVTWTAIENSLTGNVVVTAMVAKDNKVIATGGGGAILRGDIASLTQPRTLTATVPAGGTIQWLRNGSTLSGATLGDYTIANVQPADAAVYSALVTAGGSSTLQSFVVGVTSTAKVVGTGSEIAANVVHANGNTFDQVLLSGEAATITADSNLNQITRLSFVDLQNDIVQVEFSGAGTVSIVLDNPTGPATPVNYNQPTISYMKGHASIVVSGANETSNLSVFSVGRNNAVNQALFRDDVTYDGMADVAFIAIASTNGKFGGLRTANTSYFATRGLTGIYAPGVEFTGPVFAGDINASDDATAVFVIGSSTDTRITGGDLAQANSRAVQVAGLTQLKFTANTNSHGVAQPAQNNAARLEQNGSDVTAQVVVNP